MTLIREIVLNGLYNSLSDSEFEPTGGGNTEVALSILKRLLDEFKFQFPYFEHQRFTSYASLSSTVFNKIQSVDYVLDTIRFPLVSKPWGIFNEMSAVIGQTGVPEIYYFDQLLKKINVFPAPSDSEIFDVYGYKEISTITLATVVPDNFTPTFQTFIEQELARRLSARFSVTWTEQKDEIRKLAYKNLEVHREVDLTPDVGERIASSSTSNAPYPFFYKISGGP